MDDAQEKIASTVSEVSEETTPETTEPDAKKKEFKINKKLVAIILLIGLIAEIGYLSRGLFIAATVNGTPISRLSVIERLEQGTGKQALDAMITEALILSEARKQGVVVTQDEIDLEIKRVTDLVAQQNIALEDALQMRSMTMDDFKRQITIQKSVEKILGEKVLVTDAEVDAYIKGQQFDIPAEQLEEAKTQIKDQLKQSKLDNEGQTLVNSLRDSANITYLGKYQTKELPLPTPQEM